MNLRYTKNNFKDKYGPWAILAGSAEGLGKSYTLALAKRGMNIVMIDTQTDLQKSLALRVEKEFDIQTIILAIDLAKQNAAKEIIHSIRDIDCRLLIYNAAYSKIRSFASYTEEELQAFIDVNILTNIKLVHSFVQYLKISKKSGGILLMSSLAGILGMQLVAPYAATKAFTRNLAESLHYELKPYNIDIMACIAGATATPAYLETQPKYGLFKPSVMKPSTVAEATLKKLGKKTLFIPGFWNQTSYFILTRLLPGKAASFITNKTMGKMYKHKIEKE
jgi:short-subunit dehydrogenase